MKRIMTFMKPEPSDDLTAVMEEDVILVHQDDQLYSRVLYEKLRDQSEKIHDLKKIVKCLRKDAERSRKSRKEFVHPENVVLQAENAQLQIKLNKSKCAETKWKRDLQQLNSNMRDLKNHFIILKQRNMSLKQDNMDLEETIHRMRRQSEHESVHPTSRVLRDTTTEQGDTVGLTAAMVENVIIRQNNHILFKRFRDQSQEIHDLKQINEGFRKDISRSRKKKKKCVLRLEIAVLQAQNEALKELVDALQTQNELMCKDVKDLRERNAETEITLNQSKYTETEGETDPKDHNMILKQENTSLERQNGDLEKTLQEMRQQTEDERQRNEALPEPVQEAGEPTGQVLRDAIAKQCEDLQQETKGVARELKELQCKLYAMEQENESMRNRHTALDRDLQVFEHNYNATASKFEDLQRKVTNVVQELKVLDQKCHTTKNDDDDKQHQTLEQELDDVQNELSSRVVVRQKSEATRGEVQVQRDVKRTAQELNRPMVKDTESWKDRKLEEFKTKFFNGDGVIR